MGMGMDMDMGMDMGMDNKPRYALPLQTEQEKKMTSVRAALTAAWVVAAEAQWSDTQAVQIPQESLASPQYAEPVSAACDFNRRGLENAKLAQKLAS